MANALTAKVVSRFAAAQGWSIDDTLRTLVHMTPEQRSSVAKIYATDELLDEDERIVADSFRIRLKLGELRLRTNTPARPTTRTEAR